MFTASVDLKPHPLQAAVIARQSPLSKPLNEEVGLGKTIEASQAIDLRTSKS